MYLAFHACFHGGTSPNDLLNDINNSKFCEFIGRYCPSLTALSSCRHWTCDDCWWMNEWTRKTERYIRLRYRVDEEGETTLDERDRHRERERNMICTSETDPFSGVHLWSGPERSVCGGIWQAQSVEAERSLSLCQRTEQEWNSQPNLFEFLRLNSWHSWIQK